MLTQLCDLWKQTAINLSSGIAFVQNYVLFKNKNYMLFLIIINFIIISQGTYNHFHLLAYLYLTHSLAQTKYCLWHSFFKTLSFA